VSSCPVSPMSPVPAPPPRRGYPTDLCDARWRLIEAMLPPARSGTRRGGRPEAHPRREVVNALLYWARAGCAWRLLPADLPPWRTVYGFFAAWNADGTLERVLHALTTTTRAAAGRSPAPSAAVIDSQSVKAADTVATTSRGFDAAKKINGRKRHLAVDVCGFLLAVVVTSADVQDRDAAKHLIRRLHTRWAAISLIWADAAYRGRLIDWTHRRFRTLLTVITKQRPPGSRPIFAPLPRRWVVERTLAWLALYRRTARDYERRPDHAEAVIHIAMIDLTLNRLTKTNRPRRTGRTQPPPPTPA
jgi:transposase